MTRIALFLTIACAALACPLQAWSAPDDPFNSGRTSGASSKKGSSADNVFNSGRVGNFNDYRVSLNAEYARQIKEYEWRQLNRQEGRKTPDRDIKPVDPVKWDKNKGGREGREIVIEEVVTPIKRDEKAKPIAPVEVPEEDSGATVTVAFLGSKVNLHSPAARFSLSGTSKSAIADAWTRLSQPEYARLVADCINFKKTASLCDWAFIKFLEEAAKASSTGKNAVAVMMTYLASQAGYSVRLAETGDGTLDMMFASQHIIYERPYLSDGNLNFYPYFTNGKKYMLCPSYFKSETGVSLLISTLPRMTAKASDPREVRSMGYPDFRITSSVDKNLISFYDTYPTSMIGDNPVSRWAIYANTPVSPQIRQTVYPQIRQLISGLSPYEAVQRILNWIQTGFIYEYDDVVWGKDRAFFAEESLYYPYCDCEDRSILLTRIVRDLLGLKCLLVYYPGHLAAAINFPGDAAGDYIMYGNRRFTITDPTYVGAPIGSTMPKMDNSTAKIILLE